MKTIKFKNNNNRETHQFIYRFEEKVNKSSVKWIVSFNQFRIKTLHKSNLVVILYFTGLIILLESCAFTWIGRTAGGDIGCPNFKFQSNTRINKVTSEEINFGGKNTVEIHKIDSTVLTGKFLGFKPIPEIHYASKYNQFLDSVRDQFPKIGEILFVWTSGLSDRKITGEFKGFMTEGIEILTGKNTCTLPLHNIIRMTDVSGFEFDIETINKSLDLDQIPTRSGVLLKINTRQEVIIPTEEIAYARCQKGERNGKLIGTALGILIDISIIMVKSQDVSNDNSMKMIF